MRPALIWSWAIRRFLGRAVELLAKAGIRQFLDLGTGLPSQNNVHEVAQRIRDTVRALGIPHRFRQDGAGIVTISQGLSHGQPRSLAEMQSLINEADQALYRVKAQGRDGIATTTEASAHHA